jgi:hypothetical protein
MFTLTLALALSAPPKVPLPPKAPPVRADADRAVLACPGGPTCLAGNCPCRGNGNCGRDDCGVGGPPVGAAQPIPPGYGRIVDGPDAGKLIPLATATAAAPARPSYVTGQGHTHTCPRCGTTWDHGANPSHNCPACGTPQFVQDPPGMRLTLPTSSGCANGQCQTASPPARPGLFRR